MSVTDINGEEFNWFNENRDFDLGALSRQSKSQMSIMSIAIAMNLPDFNEPNKFFRT